MELILRPVRMVVSKPAQQAYLNTVLFAITSSILYGLAAFGYILFYLSFIPHIGIERVVHLQYGFGQRPHGFVSLGASLVAQQAYDIKVELDVPRSPPNLAAGNFMLDMVLLSPSYKPGTPISDFALETRSTIPNDAILHTSRRHAILTYESTIIRLSRQVASLPWFILGWRRDAEKLEIPMAEGISFSKGWRNVPTTVYVEIQGQEIQVYDIKLKLRARFSGVRWLMYNHRIISFVVFSTSFWFAEMIFAIIAWLAWTVTSSSGGKKNPKEIKGEGTDGELEKTEKEEGEDLETDDIDLSDTPRSFPTYGRQAPLKYIPKVKLEDEDDALLLDPTAIQPLAAEADDESEEPFDVGSYRDSGVGTSFSEAGGSGVARRRSSKGRKV